MITHRITNLTPSPTLSLDAKVKVLQAQGIPVINLGLGEPDFDTPLPIQQAGVEAITNGFTHYTATAGIPELKQVLAEKFKRENGIEYQPSEIIIGSGSKFLLYAVFQVLCEAGDEVLIPTPTWATYIEQAKLALAEPVLVPLTAPFKLTAKDLEPYITPRTKVILLNTPSNPTGAVIDKHELKLIGELAVKHKIWIVVDEIYERLLYQAHHVSLASLNPAFKARTITINGFSKAYAMTGWRLGYAAGPQPIIEAMVNFQTQTTSNASSISQKAALAAFKPETNQIVTKMVATFAERRQFCLKYLAELPRLQVLAPEGAFYIWVNIQALLTGQQTSAEWCQSLLDKHQVSVVPGEAFCLPGYFRLSFAASVPNLQKGLDGIRLALYDQM